MSPYTSVQDIVSDYVSKYLSWIVKDRFRNIDLIKKVVCPTLFIHGLNDQVISISHSEKLLSQMSEQLINQGKVLKHFPQEMSHNKFNKKHDLYDPLTHFFSVIKVDYSQQSMVNFNKFKLQQYWDEAEMSPKQLTSSALSNYEYAILAGQQFQQQPSSLSQDALFLQKNAVPNENLPRASNASLPLQNLANSYNQLQLNDATARINQLPKQPINIQHYTQTSPNKIYHQATGPDSSMHTTLYAHNALCAKR